MAARDCAPELDASSYPVLMMPQPVYRAVVFRKASDAQDFTCSEAIVLPGQHTAADAWPAVHAALSADPQLIGGEIRAVTH